MLNVHQVRLRFIFARALYLRRLFQKAYGRGVSELPWMAVVISSSEFACELVAQK